jgi:diguanylate cyclase (GGDEF)-like protein/PAS domain S-box-containing protein
LALSRISSADFHRRYRTLIVLAWTGPPVFGLGLLLVIDFFTVKQFITLLLTPIEPGFILAGGASAYIYLTRYVRPIRSYLEQPQVIGYEAALRCMRRFPLHFWSVFLLYLLLAPASVILSLQAYTEFHAAPIDWLRIHLVALIVSIIVGLPIFFRILDLFGEGVRDIPLKHPHVTIRAKIFLIGALIPLLTDTVIVQYYWTRTGYFSAETFLIWFFLELMAVAGALLFVRSISQSLLPLRDLIGRERGTGTIEVARLKPQSTDELGVLTSDFQNLAQRLQIQNQILEIRNQVLSTSTAVNLIEDSFASILDLCDSLFVSDKSFLLVYDPDRYELVDVAHSGEPYNPKGYYRLPLTGVALSVLAFKSGTTIIVDDAHGDARVNRQVVDETGVRASLATPLRLNDAPIGVLISSSTRAAQRYSERDARLIEVLAQEAALVVNTLMLHNQQRQAEQRYRELNELAPDPIMLLDEDQRILDVNRAAVELFGVSKEELAGLSMSELVAEEEDLPLLAVTCKRLLGGDKASMRIRLRRPGDGSVVVADVHAARISLDEKVRVQAFVRDVTAQTLAEERTRKSEHELSTILNSMQDVFARTDKKGKLLRISPSVETLLMRKPEDLVGRNFSELFFDAGDHRLFMNELRQRDGVVKGYQTRLVQADGTPVWVSVNAQYYFDENGEVAGFEGTSRDISRYRFTQDELYREKERAQVTLESIGDGVVSTDIQGRIEYMNPVAEQISGYLLEEAEGRPFADVFTLVEETTHRTISDPVGQCLEQKRRIASEFDVLLLGREGTRHAVEYSVSPTRSADGRIMGAVVGLHDVTEMRRMAQQLSHQASHDALTGLINRREFEVQLRTALERAREEEVVHALCYLDLDQFKIVNDTCGHIAGDELLKQVAGRLRERVRRADTLARLGGDEFGVLFWNCPLDVAEKLADELRTAIRQTRFSWHDRAFEIGSSIGLVPIEAGSGTITDLLSAADSACYAAKDRGRNRIYVYQPDDKLLAKRHGEMQWVSRIANALEEDRLKLYAQRILALGRGSATSHWEIMVRMLDESGEIVPPMAFIPAAERYHVMPSIDRTVIRKTLKLLAAEAPRAKDDLLHFNINISGQTLSEESFVEFVISEVQRTGADPKALCFEITETAAIANLAYATRVIAVLGDLGIRFALDDFGSGLSSFGYLKNLNVDYLKIDGSFVRDIMEDPIDLAMVESINHIGHTLGLETIAEFVETKEVLEAVRGLGVDYAQGYAVSQPVPIDEAVCRKTEIEEEDRS